MSLAMPTTLEALAIQPVKWPISWIIRQLVAIWLVLILTWLPDPKRASWEIQEELSRSEKEAANKKATGLDKGFVKYFSQRHKAALATTAVV